MTHHTALQLSGDARPWVPAALSGRLCQITANELDAPSGIYQAGPENRRFGTGMLIVSYNYQVPIIWVPLLRALQVK